MNDTKYDRERFEARLNAMAEDEVRALLTFPSLRNEEIAHIRQWLAALADARAARQKQEEEAARERAAIAAERAALAAEKAARLSLLAAFAATAALLMSAWPYLSVHWE